MRKQANNRKKPDLSSNEFIIFLVNTGELYKINFIENDGRKKVI